jgi:hypothetical protein
VFVGGVWVSHGARGTSRLRPANPPAGGLSRMGALSTNKIVKAGMRKAPSDWGLLLCQLWRVGTVRQRMLCWSLCLLDSWPLQLVPDARQYLSLPGWELRSQDVK